MSWGRVRGHDAPLNSLRAAYEAGRLGQAYLFAGPDGIGKELFAKELAKALLCDRPPAPLAACDSCPACAQVGAGTHPDVFAVRTPPGKHELPVDDMRAFCAKMAMKPTRDGRKVGVVETADDLNEESANSFLKTLEEPPPGSLLVLLVTDLDRQLPTIRSRCQIVRFAPLGPADLRAVLAEQGVEADRLDKLARLADGSPARALALNDDAVWTVRQKLVEGATAPRPNFGAMAEAWQGFYEAAGKDTAAQRVRASLVVGFLVEAVQQALRLAVGADVPELDAAEAGRLKAFADRLGPDRLADLLDRLLDADNHIDRRAQLGLVVEAVLEHLTRPAGVGVAAARA